jgi:hypothetical protein
MTEHRFQDIWKQQCVAARGIRVQHGILSALDYLIGEKLLTYADTAVTKPEFARELPRFVSEVRDIFRGEEIRHYLDHLERMAVIEDEQATDEDNSDFLKDSAEQLAAKRARFAQLRERRPCWGRDRNSVSLSPRPQFLSTHLQCRVWDSISA